MQRGESRAAVTMVQGAAVGPVSPAAAAAPSPPLATASAVAQAHWRRRPQNKSRAASPCLRKPACNGVRAEQPLRWCKGLLSPSFRPPPLPPVLATASAVAQAHWHRRPQNKSRAASPCLRQPACNGVRAEQPLRWCKGLLSAQFSPAAAAARSSHSERRSSSPLAPPPAKQVPDGFSMLTATCM